MWTSARIGLHVAPGAVRTYDLRRRQATGVFPTLDAALDPHHRSRARVEVVLADAHCRYLVMARPDGIRSRSELTAAMQNRFRTVFGDSDGWQLQLGAGPPSAPDFVAGVDRALVDRIESVAAAAGVRVTSIRPQWVAWVRHFQARLRRGSHWVVVADGAWASVGYLSDGHCRQVRVVRLDAAGSLDDLLARERAFLADADAAAPVWLGGTGDATLLSVPGIVTACSAAALWGMAEGLG